MELIFDEENRRGWIAFDIVWDAVTQPKDLPSTVVIDDAELTQGEVGKYLAKEYGMSVYSFGIKPLMHKEHLASRDGKVAEFRRRT